MLNEEIIVRAELLTPSRDESLSKGVGGGGGAGGGN